MKWGLVCICLLLSCQLLAKGKRQVAYTKDTLYQIFMYDTSLDISQQVREHHFHFAINHHDNILFFRKGDTIGTTTYSDVPLADSQECSFPGYLLDLIMRHKIDAYPQSQSIIADTTLDAMTVFKEHFPFPDLSFIEDPVTGYLPLYVRMEIRFERLDRKIRVYAREHYNKRGKKIKTEIIALAPYHYVVTDLGEHIGYRDLYRVKYTDVAPIIRNYEKLHPECILSKQIARIKSGKKLKPIYAKGTFVNSEKVNISIYDTTNPSTKNTLEHTFVYWDGSDDHNAKIRFRNAKTDSVYPNAPFADSVSATFPEYLLDAVLRGKLQAYERFTLYDYNNLSPLTPFATFMTYYEQHCHFRVSEPEENEPILYRQRRISFERATELNVLLQKTIFSKRAKRSYKKQTTFISIAENHYADNGDFRGKIDHYSLKYADALPFIKAYERIHPECIISKEIEKLLNK